MMKNITHETKLTVDLLNPGHFFACCGILHAADRMFDSVHGRFDKDEFVIETELENPVHAILKEVSKASLQQYDDESDSPLRLTGKTETRLDFWNHFDNRPTIKLFAGQEKSRAVVGRWIDHMKAQKSSDVRDLWASSVIDVPSGFDTHTSWNSLDIGFSLNEQGMKRRSFPLIEFFAYLGVQSYGWHIVERTEEYCYNAWTVPLPNMVAKAVAAGALEFPGTRHFRTRTRKSGQKKTFIEAQEASHPC